MKPSYQKIIIEPQQSWRFQHHCYGSIELNSHHHPEYELALTCGSQGVRYIGSNSEVYQDNDLVLIGPNLPHGWQSTASYNSPLHHVYVLHFPSEWIEQWLKLNQPLRSLQSILEASRHGVKFSEETVTKVKPLILELEHSCQISRQVLLLKILWQLSLDHCPQRLCFLEQRMEDNINKNRKIDKLIHHINQNYMNDINAAQLAKFAHMSINHLHRFFKQKTEMTITQYIIQLRLELSCDMLINTNFSIELIASKSGFNSIANFNRQFLKNKKLTPRQYRQQETRRINFSAPMNA